MTKENTMDKVVHFELPFDDMARAKKFYQKAFGWEMTDVPEMEYVMAITAPLDSNRKYKEAGAINGGLFKREKKVNAPVIAIQVASVDEAVKRVEKAGGKVIIPKIMMGNMGYYARVADTEGNVIGVWQEMHA